MPTKDLQPRYLGRIARREGQLPVAQVTDELIEVQALRSVYYMSQGTAAKLPFTIYSLYDWMRLNVGGIDIRAGRGLSCCQTINGKKIFTVPQADSLNRLLPHSWFDISIAITGNAWAVRVAEGKFLTNPPAIVIATAPWGGPCAST